MKKEIEMKKKTEIEKKINLILFFLSLIINFLIFIIFLIISNIVYWHDYDNLFYSKLNSFVKKYIQKKKINKEKIEKINKKLYKKLYWKNFYIKFLNYIDWKKSSYIVKDSNLITFKLDLYKIFKNNIIKHNNNLLYWWLSENEIFDILKSIRNNHYHLNNNTFNKCRYLNLDLISFYIWFILTQRKTNYPIKNLFINVNKKCLKEFYLRYLTSRDWEKQIYKNYVYTYEQATKSKRYRRININKWIQMFNNYLWKKWEILSIWNILRKRNDYIDWYILVYSWNTATERKENWGGLCWVSTFFFQALIKIDWIKIKERYPHMIWFKTLYWYNNIWEDSTIYFWNWNKVLKDLKLINNTYSDILIEPYTYMLNNSFIIWWNFYFLVPYKKVKIEYWKLYCSNLKDYNNYKECLKDVTKRNKCTIIKRIYDNWKEEKIKSCYFDIKY